MIDGSPQVLHVVEVTRDSCERHEQAEGLERLLESLGEE
jgi:hypothetical protein